MPTCAVVCGRGRVRARALLMWARHRPLSSCSAYFLGQQQRRERGALRGRSFSRMNPLGREPLRAGRVAQTARSLRRSIGGQLRDLRSFSARLAVLLALLTSTLALVAHAEPATAPFPVQAQILARILPYDRGFAARVKGDVVVLLLQKANDSESSNAVQQMGRALNDIGEVRKAKIRVHTLEYTSAAALAAACASQGVHVLYVAPGFRGQVAAIARALVGSGILSVAAVEPYVQEGAVLGVDIVSGKPRMSIHLAQSRAQKIDFPAAVLNLAKVY